MIGRWARMSTLRAWFDHLADLSLSILSPRACAACDAPLSARAVFCIPCARSVERCSSSVAPFFYGGAVAEAIQKMKYKGRADLAYPLGGLLRVALQSSHKLSDPIDVVVPVPLHPSRIHERGYNQATLLARHAAKAVQGRLIHALLRVRDTKKQALADRAERLVNVEGAFLVRVNVAGLRVLLVDDVCTTGATLKSCRDSLLAAGARDVQCFALAQTWGAPSPIGENRAIINQRDSCS